MSGVVPILPRLKFTDQFGKPLASGSVTVYLAGTTTLATTWQDEALTIPNTNPITLDANGAGMFWIDRNLRYKVLLRFPSPDGGITPGATVPGYPIDNVPGAGGEGPLDALTFTQTAAGAVARPALDKLREVSFSPRDVGAVGDGVADDADALLAALSWMRTLINAAGGNLMISLDLVGGVYRTTKSLNATALASGWEIKNGVINGECTGKCVLDMVGSRSGRLTNLVIHGSQIHRPTVGLQAARSSVPGFEFCDGLLADRVFTTGWFSVAAHIFYGQEGSVYRRCQFWNSDKDAYIGVMQGSNIVPMSSDYLAPMTGPTSYINDKYINCDWLFLPVSASATITGITKANPAVVTAPGHPFVNGDFVSIGFVNGMTQINNLTSVVANVTANTFQLTGIDSTAFSTYTNGGQAVIVQTKPSILFSRAAQHDFDTCYCVNYGSDSIQVDFADGFNMAQVHMDFLFEGSGSRSHLRFANVGAMLGFALSTYNSHCRDWIISTAAVAGTITLQNAKITHLNASYSNPALFDVPARYAVFGGDVCVPSSASFTPTTLGANFNGRLNYISTGATTIVNDLFADYRDALSVAAAVSASVGAINTATSQLTYRRIGKMVWFSINVFVTDNGTGSGLLQVALPFTAAVAVRCGGTNASNNKSVTGSIAAAGSTLSILLYDGTYPVVTGQTVILSGWLLEA